MAKNKFRDEYEDEDDYRSNGRKLNKNHRDRQNKAAKKRTQWWDSETFAEPDQRKTYR